MREIKVLLILLGFLNPIKIRALLKDGATEDELEAEVMERPEDICVFLTFVKIFMQPDSDLAQDICPAWGS